MIPDDYSIRFSRTLLLIGNDELEKLYKSKVLIVGLGGVGSYAFEAIVRGGVGTIYILDSDVVEISNCNRQLIALDSTIGMPKVDVAYNRAKDINPAAVIHKNMTRVTADNVEGCIPNDIDFIIDAIDDVEAKTALIVEAIKRKIPFVSCMGAARALNPQSLCISDISKTQYCPLARVIRKRLKERGITRGVQCIYFHEERTGLYTKTLPGSLSYMPGIMGLAAAGVAITFLRNR